MSDERPTIPGTKGWPDHPVTRALIALNAVKTMDGRAGEDHDGTEYVRLVLAAAGESLDAEDVLRSAAMAAETMLFSAFDRVVDGPLDELDLSSFATSLWLDGFLHGVAAAHRLWGDDETGVVELRPEESDDAR